MRLREATDAQKRARDVLARQEWDASLTEAEFLAREAALRGHPWARDVMTTWLWEDDGGVLSSCETFRQPSHVGGAPGFAWAVASVLTEPRLRGQGHAVRMMTALVTRLRAQPGAQASVLYSEVGARIYERAGYRLVGSAPSPGAADRPAPYVNHVRLPPRRERPRGVELLEAPPAPRARAAAEGVLRIVPTAAELDWHLERERFYAALRGATALPLHGARRGDATISFALVPKANEVAVLWLDCPEAGDLLPLLEAAQFAAAQAGAAQVRVWELEPLPLPGVPREANTDALPMFAPLCDGIETWSPIHRGLWV